MMRKTKKRFICVLFDCYTILSIFIMTALEPLYLEEHAHASPREETVFENFLVNIVFVNNRVLWSTCYFIPPPQKKH